MPVASNKHGIPFHLRMFTEFCRWEIASGGPDPHMKMAEYLAVRSPDPLWSASCYTAPYVVSTATAITNRFSRQEVLADSSKLTRWINDNWLYLPIRKERRVNGVGPDKLAEIIASYARWLEDGGIERLEGLPYQEVFEQLNPPHYGRYFRMKLYEVLRRVLLATKAKVQLPEMGDIIPKGGHHPRKCLLHFYPQHQHKSNKPADMQESNTMAGELKDRLAEKDVNLGWFTIEVLLCNYRQAVNGGQYPGRAHDSELGHYKIVRKRFPDVTKVLQCRTKMFDSKCLGEVGDKWPGRRLELGKVLMQHDYMWSDMLYDYRSTKDLAKPVCWPCI